MIKIGMVLPHFGAGVSGSGLLRLATDCEAMGFDSVWVRDHFAYQPHRTDDPDRTFVDAFVVLAAVGAVTTSVQLGTATLIPFRHPIHAARLVASLDMIAGSGRTIVGIGLGGSDREFALVGMDGWDRRKVVPEYVDIMRRLWRGEDVSYEGQFFSFENVCVRPAPSTVPPIWYAGMSPAAVRRAVLFGDGWMPSHTPMRVLHERVRLLRELSDGEGRSAPLIAPIAYVVPEMAGVQLDGMRLLNEANYRYGQSGETPFRTLRDLAGMLITGTDEEIVRGVRELEDAGASCVIFDLRLVFSRLLPVLDYLGERVLPLLKQ